MARTIVVSALTALGVALAFAALTKPPAPDEAPSERGVEGDVEFGRRLSALEERVEGLALRQDRKPPRLEGTATFPLPRVEALEARLAVIEAEARKMRAAGLTTERRTTKPTPTPEALEKELRQWVDRLHDKNESVAFSAALQLARMKDLRATDPLIAVLKHHRDFYVRLAAATALGDIGALDGVPYLIEALDDKDTLVRAAANDALRQLTDGEVVFNQEFDARERAEAQETWRRYWVDNEVRLRTR